MNLIYALLAGVLLDFLLGDPPQFPHPVRLFGWLIDRLEKILRSLFPKTEQGEKTAGTLLAIFLVLLVFGGTFGILWIARRWSPGLGFAVETLFCYQALAAKSLDTESKKVFERLAAEDLPGARQAVSRIVGRDTQELSTEAVSKAAVETVAENTADGVIAPLIYLCVGGGALGFCYKMINTMDSMLGYKNERYLHFGRFAAKLDDLANFIPARISGLLLVLSAWILRMDGKNAWKIFRRDRFCHASPNSAQSESAVAGALQIQLAGDAVYFGKLQKKPFIGDPIRSVERSDILKSNQLMFCAELLCLFFCVAIRGTVAVIF